MRGTGGRNMSHEIVQIQQMGDALRNTGYKNIESAVSEIVDNSIEAEAMDVFILLFETVNPISGTKSVSEIGFLDNGVGMSIDLLGKCLGMGSTTKLERKGIGRFGVGLPQASLYAGPSVDVYSWQNGYKNCHKVFLDINKVKSGEQTCIEDPKEEGIPSRYTQFLHYTDIDGHRHDFLESGTFVHWKNCDRVSPKTIRFLMQRLEFSLGQKFRYLIMNGSHTIRLIPVDNQEFQMKILPNDPLLLMKPNYALGKLNDPGSVYKNCDDEDCVTFFKPYSQNDEYASIIHEVHYYDKDTRIPAKSKVEISFSIIKDEFYDQTACPANPGGTEMGKHVAKLEGISIVRAGREIDFGDFDFYSNINEPQHRWWGCEIRFTPELDEAFGVANNKQHVELHAIDPEDYSEEPIKPVWLQLYPIIYNTIKSMFEKNKETRKKSRTIEEIVTPATEIINEAEENVEVESLSEKKREETDQKELFEKQKEILKEAGIVEVSDEQVMDYMNNVVNITYKNNGRGPFFDYSFELGNSQISINTAHQLYLKFIHPVSDNPDIKTLFELLISAYVRAVDETSVLEVNRRVCDTLFSAWNEKLRLYIDKHSGLE